MQVAVYGQCVQANLDNIGRNACANEFEVMKKCSQRVLSKLRGAGRK